MVVKKYNAEINDEAKRKLIGENYRKALEEKKLNVIGYPDIEEITFARGQNLQFAATIETAPEFELPEYKGLPAKREDKSVSDADVDRAWMICSRNSTTSNLKPSRAKSRWEISRSLITTAFAMANPSPIPPPTARAA